MPTRIVVDYHFLIILCRTLLFNRHYNGCILLLLSLLHCKVGKFTVINSAVNQFVIVIA